MNQLSCDNALQLFGQRPLSGEVLAARWHVHNCLHCQRMLDALWTDIALLDDRLALEQLLHVDLKNAVCERGARVITWVTRQTRQVLAVAIRLSEPAMPLVPGPQLRTMGPALIGDEGMGADDTPRPSVLHQEEAQTPDGFITWKVTFLVDSHSPEYCRAEVQIIDLNDSWDLASIEVFIVWPNEQRHGYTDAVGQVSFGQIPIAALGHANIVIKSPQTLTRTNGPQ